MAECINYNCAELGEYEPTIQNCGSKVVNGGGSIAWLLECDAEIDDPGNQTQIDALIAAGTATEVSNLKIGFTAPSEITQDSVTSCGSAVTINYNREINIEDYKVTVTNTDFWNAVAKRSFGGMIIKECTTDGLPDRVTYINAEIVFKFYRDFPNSVDVAQKYVITGGYKKLEDPTQELYTP